MQNMSIVITGNPGTGKHTVAEKIKDIINMPIIDINEFAKECRLLEKNKDANDVDTEMLAKKLKEKITVPHIIVGHLAPYSVSGIPIKAVILLRRNPKELESVYKQRGYDEKKTKDNLGSEVLGIIANDTINNIENQKIIQVDVSGKNISNVIEIVVDAINGKQESQQVDWLENLKDSELKSYFSYD